MVASVLRCSFVMRSYPGALLLFKFFSTCSVSFSKKVGTSSVVFLGTSLLRTSKLVYSGSVYGFL